MRLHRIKQFHETDRSRDVMCLHAHRCKFVRGIPEPYRIRQGMMAQVTCVGVGCRYYEDGERKQKKVEDDFR